MDVRGNIKGKFMPNPGLRGKRELHQRRANIVHAVASIPKTFMLGIRDKRSEAGKAFGCSVDVGDLSPINAGCGKRDGWRRVVHHASSSANRRISDL